MSKRSIDWHSIYTFLFQLLLFSAHFSNDSFVVQCFKSKPNSKPFFICFICLFKMCSIFEAHFFYGRISKISLITCKLASNDVRFVYHTTPSADDLNTKELILWNGLLFFIYSYLMSWCAHFHNDTMLAKSIQRLYLSHIMRMRRIDYIFHSFASYGLLHSEMTQFLLNTGFVYISPYDRTSFVLCSNLLLIHVKKK